MRSLGLVLAGFALLAAPLYGAELKVSVTDPQQAAVRGARVALYRAANTAAGVAAVALAIQSTAADGSATFGNLSDGSYRVEVLAAGFAAQTVAVKLPVADPLAIQLVVAGKPETVVVTAAGTPLPAADTGSAVTLLDSTRLEAMLPYAASDALRFLPGAVVNTAGRRGGLSSLFVRGGESRYNKVLVDGVPIDEPGGIFDFGVASLDQVDRLEFVRGAESTLYGSDAMTSVVELVSASGRTRTPELRFGADGGNFSTANGYASLAGARGRFDYNLWASQFWTRGQGVNDEYSNSSQGGNLGVLLSRKAFFRLRARHSNNRTGVQSFWDFNGQPLLEPDQDQRARQNNFLASAELSLAAPGRWQHRLTGFEYHHTRSNVDLVADRGCGPPLFLDCPFSDLFTMNRAGLDYQGEYSSRRWSRTTLGYQLEVENGFVTQDFSGFAGATHGLRRNHALYGQQVFTFSRVSLIAGLRFVHNENFGNKAVPRVAASVLALRGGELFSGTRLRFVYGEGIKEPRLEESFGIGAFNLIPNPGLKPEETRSLEAGVQQEFDRGKYSLSATWFDNLFRNQIAFSFNPLTFASQYVNLNRAFAHGAELEFHGRPHSGVTLDAAYIYTSTQILEAPLAFDPLLAAGAPLLRRPKHSGSILGTYSGKRWGGSLGASFVGRRTDSDFLGLGVNHAAGYARLDLGGWYAINRHVTAYANLGNALDKRYEEAAGYPALRVNFRAGLRFRIGGD
jgi:outer membrane cobalamin receptor